MKGEIISSIIIALIGAIPAIATLFLTYNQYKKAKEKEKMAYFRCWTEALEKLRPGYNIKQIHFKNVGKSDAKNVRIEMLPPEDEIEKEKFLKFINKNKLGPYELINSGSEKVDLVEFYIPENPQILKLKITWDDGYDNNRPRDFSVDLY